MRSWLVKYNFSCRFKIYFKTPSVIRLAINFSFYFHMLGYLNLPTNFVQVSWRNSWRDVYFIKSTHFDLHFLKQADSYFELGFRWDISNGNVKNIFTGLINRSQSCLFPLTFCFFILFFRLLLLFNFSIDHHIIELGVELINGGLRCDRHRIVHFQIFLSWVRILLD